MTGKITAAVTAAVLLASAGVASAQTHRHAAQVGAQPQAAYTDSYYNRDYWAGSHPPAGPSGLTPLPGPCSRA